MRIQNFLFHQLVRIRSAVRRGQQLAPGRARPFGRFFALFQERFETTVFPLEYFDGIGLQAPPCHWLVTFATAPATAPRAALFRQWRVSTASEAVCAHGAGEPLPNVTRSFFSRSW